MDYIGNVFPQPKNGSRLIYISRTIPITVVAANYCVYKFGGGAAFTQT